jgi:hypothetical protein
MSTRDSSADDDEADERTYGGWHPWNASEREVPSQSEQISEQVEEEVEEEMEVDEDEDDEARSLALLIDAASFLDAAGNFPLIGPVVRPSWMIFFF